MRATYKYYHQFRSFNGVLRKSFHSQPSIHHRPNVPKIFYYGIAVGAIIAYDGVFHNFGYLGATQRFLRSLKLAACIAGDYYWNLRNLNQNDQQYDEVLKQINLRSANRILDGCLANGGLYIKIGQGVSAINHILPEEYTHTLSKLQNECLPSKSDDVRNLFRQDFGETPEQIFAEFDYKPIAAASLAQVFKAKLKTGEDVAVKVQYIDLQDRFSSDFNTIIFLQNIIEMFFKNYNFGWILKDIRKNLEQELDFANEGKNAERCAKDMTRFKFVHIPEVYWDLTKKRILTTEWVDGFKVTDKAKIEFHKINTSDLNKKLFEVFSEQIFNTGFVHADPHPGNVFLREGQMGKIEIILLDHGLYEYLPENIRTPLCKFWEATVLKDENCMLECANALNINDHRNFAEVLFQTPFELRAGSFKTKLTDDDLDYFRSVAKNHFDSIMRTLKEMPRNMLFVVRNLNTIRAIGREHGDPVDRGTIMARYAQKCIYSKQNIFLGYLKWILRRIRFEYCLLKASIKMFLLSHYLDLLYKMGRSPADSQFYKFSPA